MDFRNRFFINDLKNHEFPGELRSHASCKGVGAGWVHVAAGFAGPGREGTAERKGQKKRDTSGVARAVREGKSRSVGSGRAAQLRAASRQNFVPWRVA